MMRIRSTPLLYTLMALSVSNTSAQHVSVPSTAECVELNQRVLIQVASGQFAAAEAALAAALAVGAYREQESCTGFVLNNMASIMAFSGRTADAEALADRSLKILEKIYPPDDWVLLRPLQILASTRFEQGKMTRAREAFKRMQTIRNQRPEDSALVHGMAGAFFQADGSRGEAEAEYLVALHALAEAGRGETADAGGILNSLGSLYIEEHRLDEARRVLDRALTIFNHATDAVPMDSIKLLALRGVLHARQGEWQEAEHDFSNALSMADRESKLDSAATRSILVSYGVVLRKNHKRREAGSIEARAAALGRNHTKDDVVDVTDLFDKPKRVGK
jgi:tetratricopeptide (TPR) repeat protein